MVSRETQILFEHLYRPGVRLLPLKLDLIMQRDT